MRTPELNTILDGIRQLAPEQQWWLAGYIEGQLSRAGAPAGLPGPGQAPAPGADAGPPLTILFGSQTGNAEALSKSLGQRWQGNLSRVNIHSLGRFKLNRLKKEQLALFVVSTHGEGDPPDSTLAFFNSLMAEDAPRLPGLKYAVIGLGDTSYKHFCKPARLIDERLRELGATPALSRLDCDLDYQTAVSGWEAGFLAEIKPDAAANTPAPILSLAPNADEQSARATAEVGEIVNLCLDEADKRVWHVELEADLDYQCGDAVAVLFSNPDSLADAVIELVADYNPEERFGFAGNEGLSLREILIGRAELYRLNYKQISEFQELFPDAGLAGELGGDDAIDAFIDKRGLVDLLRFASDKLTAQTLIRLLAPMTDRLYSIASSPSAHPGEIHITVREQAHGLASPRIAQLAKGDNVDVYIKSNPAFRLPENPSGDAIFIGAGTGVAPYRSFLSERLEQAGQGIDIGRNWLIMGEQSFYTSFLYQLDWQYFISEGVLNEISLAFSRDQDRKIYIHHRMLENAAKLYQWIDSGATLYVCGDRKRMAADVHQALLRIYSDQTGADEARAQAWLAELAAEGRYQRDIY